MKELPDRILAQSLDPEGVDLDILTGSIEPGEWTKGDYKELFRIGGESTLFYRMLQQLRIGDRE